MKDCFYWGLESHFNGSDMSHMWQGLQTIITKGKAVTLIKDTNVLPSDKLNTLSPFEDNNATDAGRSRELWAHILCGQPKTFKRVNAC